MRSARIPLLLALLPGVWSCDATGPDPAAGRLRAFVSILPQASFVERVGGEHVAVEVLVGPGQSPHAYEPTPRQMAALAGSRVYFSIGVPFEKSLLGKLATMARDLRIVDTREGIPLRKMTDGHDEGARHDHEHPEGTPDPHVWLNPRLAKLVAANIAKALKELDPQHAADYEANLKAFQADLDRVDARVAEALAPLRGKSFMVFHPAFGYFGDAYGLTQEAVEIEGKEPTARQLAALIEKAKARGVRVIFVQPQFSRAGAAAVASAIDGVVVPMDPLARNYIENLEVMATQIQGGLR